MVLIHKPGQYSVMAQKAQQAATDKLAAARLMKAAQVLEETLDQEINRLDHLDEDGLEAIRRNRLKQMKNESQQRSEWIAAGHGVYSELGNEQDFFAACKKSPFGVVCHFYRDSTFRCKIIDKHLSILAPKHIECRMIKLNAEKSPFLTQRLGIIVIPTIILVKNEQVCDRIIGFDDLGGHDEFSTAMLEWRLAVGQVIQYSGDITTPPDSGKPGSITFKGFDAKKREIKTIRGKSVEDGDEDSD
ncbi:hypothetical protein CRM22_003389 [Opisthorchis felineus]|uniref:Thioredoxin domain-containing protein 9 n=1 Tax=Opisthorchis felineus TaxID=147828 RepID=A0A4S2M209_OPIFE|nr:hypothetical protein CRM22_003389 [Opisthorchis felineus]